MRISRLRFPALLLALAAGACRDVPTAAPPADAPAPQAQRAELRCSVAVASRAIACEPTGPRGVRRNIIMGGQGLNVRLRTTNLAWNEADSVLSADVSVQNLLDQPIGTDGTSSYGVRVFFVLGPNVTQGTGSVTVLADSMGTFTAANQKYFVYPEVIQPREVSAPQSWGFSVAGDVTTFEFFLLVETQTPAETSILHFRPEHGSPVFYAPLYGVWAGTAHDVFAVTDGAVLHYDGNYWRAMDAGGCACTSRLFAVWGSDGRDVYAVGGSGTVAHWTGTTWDEVDTGYPGGDLYAVWGSSATDVWTVGEGGKMLHYDGVGWTNDGPVGFETPLYGVWGSAPHDVWAVGDAGAILHYDGAWSADTAIAGATFNAVWGTGAGDVWAAGSVDDGSTGVLYHNDGTGWAEVSDPELSLTGLLSGWSSGPHDVWITSGGDVLHWDGAAWTRLAVGSGIPLYGITGTSASDVFTVGDLGVIAHSSGGAFADMALPEPGSLYSLWGSSASDVWAVGDFVMMHRTGGTWTSQPAPDYATLYAVWGASASEVWAAGDFGAIVHYDGADWSTVHVDSALTLNALWGASATDVWAAGSDGAVVHWDGAAWSTSSAGTDTHFGLWGSAAGNVFAVGDNGSIQHWDGGAWTPMNSGVTETLLAVWGSGPGDVWAAGADGAVLHYDGDPSLNWTAVSVPFSGPVNAIWGSGPNDVFMLANFGLDLVHWDGAAWKTMSRFSGNAGILMYTLWGTGPRNLYAAGDAGTVLHGLR
jgi:hypothetical protein